MYFLTKPIAFNDRSGGYRRIRMDISHHNRYSNYSAINKFLRIEENGIMQAYSKLIIGLLLVSTLGAFAAEPTNIEELKAYYASLEGDNSSFTADYNMTMDMAAAGQPQAAVMGEMGMGGKFVVKGDKMRMSMSMKMGEGDGAMNMDMTMIMGDDNVMHMLMEMPGMTQAMKMDMSVMAELADAMGVPESALNSGNMGGGMMSNPTKILEVYEEMYAMKLVGKETLNGEDVYKIEATIKAEILENFEKSPLLQGQMGMFDNGVTIYMGANDGIMRKTKTGDFMTMTMSNFDFETPINDSDFELELPDGVIEIDMTAMMKGMFGNIAASGGEEDKN